MTTYYSVSIGQDELQEWLDAALVTNREFRYAYYQYKKSNPWPLMINGKEYHKRQRRRKIK